MVEKTKEEMRYQNRNTKLHVYDFLSLSLFSTSFKKVKNIQEQILLLPGVYFKDTPRANSSDVFFNT